MTSLSWFRPKPELHDACLDLRTMRRAVSRRRRAAVVLPDLRGRAAVCEMDGAGLAHARAAFGTPQACLSRRSRPDRRRSRAGVCDRPARAAGAGGRWLRALGL